METDEGGRMTPGYQGTAGEDDPLYGKHGHDALSGNDFEPGIESENPDADRILRRDILNSLKAHPEIDTGPLNIHVKSGYVSLNGEVNSPDEKATIEALVAKTEGVLDVVNFLKLKRGYDTGSSKGISR